MLTDTKLAVHPDLIAHHQSATCCKSGNGCCCGDKLELADNACVNFVGCGPDIRCGTPCRHCIAWEGHGGDEVVQAIKLCTQPK